MKRSVIFCLYVLVSCSVNPKYILSEDASNGYVLTESSFRKLSSEIFKGNTTILDEIYNIADSLSGISGYERTLCYLSDKMSYTFFNPLSQFHNDSIYLDIIRKEDACRNFPSDYKKVISFRKSIINRGKAGSLFPYMLGENKLSLVLVKSEDCRLCKKLDKQVIHSSSIQKAIDDNTLNYFVLDTMNNPEILELLDTRLIPSLYLVNEAGIVIIKGATDISVIVDLLQCHSIL